MSMYSVLMVDDEEDVVRAMQKKIDWESIGFRIMGYAHNGIEALDLAEQEGPDVVLTDIKMPYMDGLELAHNLKIMYPAVRILIFSGFDEFFNLGNPCGGVGSAQLVEGLKSKAVFVKNTD